MHTSEILLIYIKRRHKIQIIMLASSDNTAFMESTMLWLMISIVSATNVFQTPNCDTII